MHNFYYFAQTMINQLESVKQLPNPNSGEPQIKLILGIVFGIVGALCVLFITIAGLRYVLSAGDPQKANQAKEGIIYALVGLVVVIAAQAIATFVIGRV